MNAAERFREHYVVGEGVKWVASGITGFSSPQVMAAINTALRMTDDGYLEIGVMNGLTLCGAMAGNEGRLFVGVDDFSQFSGSREILLDNIETFSPEADLHFYDLDYRQFFENYAWLYRNCISVYFYDAAHSYEDQLDGLLFGLASSILTSEAFMVVDDYSWPDTKQATGEFLRNYPEWSLIVEENDDWNVRGWWNGLAILYREAT